MVENQKIKVAIFEDSPNKMMVINLMMRVLGCEVISIAKTVEEGEELLGKILVGESAFQADIVLMDANIGDSLKIGHRGLND